MDEKLFLKVIFDGASFWLGNTLVHNLNPKLEHQPTLQNLAVWTIGNILIRYNIIEHLKLKKIIQTNDGIYFTLGLISSIVNLILGENFLKTIKINSVGTLSNITMSRFIKR